ncbi:MAG: winged helix-turn-helix transcriptional regulator [Promethearchaeota archaeon]
MNTTEDDNKYIINPDNFKEFFERLPEMREAMRLGIKRELEENKSGKRQSEVDLSSFRSYGNISRKKWTFVIMLSISFLEEPYFNDLKKALPLISARILTSRLKTLNKLDIIERVVHDSQPVRVSYKMTKFGDGLRNLWGSFIVYVTSKKQYD